MSAVPSLGKNSCEDSGPMAKNTSYIQNDREIQCNTENYVPFVFPGLRTGLSNSSTSTSSTSVSQDTTDDSSSSRATTRSWSTRSRTLGDHLGDSTGSKNNKNEDFVRARRSPLRDLPEWLEAFVENFVDEAASASSEAPASISREPLHQEPSIKVVSGKHSFVTHFLKDRNCEFCKRTKITRAPLQKTHR